MYIELKCVWYPLFPSFVLSIPTSFWTIIFKPCTVPTILIFCRACVVVVIMSPQLRSPSSASSSSYNSSSAKVLNPVADWTWEKPTEISVNWSEIEFYLLQLQGQIARYCSKACNSLKMIRCSLISTSFCTTCLQFNFDLREFRHDDTLYNRKSRLFIRKNTFENRKSFEVSRLKTLVNKSQWEHPSLISAFHWK